MQDLDTIYHRLRNAKLTLQPSKCTFVAREALYLGHIVDKQFIRSTDTSIAAVVDYPLLLD